MSKNIFLAEILTELLHNSQERSKFILTTKFLRYDRLYSTLLWMKDKLFLRFLLGLKRTNWFVGSTFEDLHQRLEDTACLPGSRVAARSKHRTIRRMFLTLVAVFYRPFFPFLTSRRVYFSFSFFTRRKTCIRLEASNPYFSAKRQEIEG